MSFLEWFGFRSKPPPKREPFDLETVLLHLSERDGWTIRHACEGLHVFGGVGSGKTSGSGRAFARAFLNAGMGGLVMCAKPSERELWERYAREAGRSDHVIVVSPENAWRFNFLDYEMRRTSRGGGHTENLVNLFSVIMEIAQGGSGRMESDGFWERAAQQLIRNAVDVIYLANGGVTLDDLSKLVAEAPRSKKEAQSEEWLQTSYCAKCFAKAVANIEAAKDAGQDVTRRTHDCVTAEQYFSSEWAELGDKTRGSIVATFSSVADVLSHGVAWELLSTTTNLVPETTFMDGAIIILDMPVQQYRQIGRLVQGIFKYAFQRAVLQRDWKQHPRPVFLWADEAQNFVSSYDEIYQSAVREHRGCTVYLTQNVSNYYSVLGRQNADAVTAILGNLQTQVFHANSDSRTNTYAAELIGKTIVMSQGHSGQSVFNGGGVTISENEAERYKVMPVEFTTLRRGGPDNGMQTEAVIFRGGNVWNATGDTYLPVVFRQG